MGEYAEQALSENSYLGRKHKHKQKIKKGFTLQCNCGSKKVFVEMGDFRMVFKCHTCGHICRVYVHNQRVRDKIKSKEQSIKDKKNVNQI